MFENFYLRQSPDQRIYELKIVETVKVNFDMSRETIIHYITSVHFEHTYIKTVGMETIVTNGKMGIEMIDEPESFRTINEIPGGP